MQINQFYVSRQAARRMVQRNLSPEDIAAVLRFGHRVYAYGATFFCLRLLDLPPGRDRELERLVGTTVITRGSKIIAAFRDPKLLSAIRRMPRRAIRSLLYS